MLLFTPPWLKKAVALSKGVRKFLQYNRDLMPPDRLEEVERLRGRYQDAIKRRDREEVEKLEPELLKNCESAVPDYRSSPLRENIEVIIVAVVVALGIRAYFLQPFKIPTASMQPTLNGITAQKMPPEQPMPNVAKWAFDLVARGRNYPELKVPEDFPPSVVVAARQTNRRIFGLKVPLTGTEIDLQGSDGKTRTLSVAAPARQLFESLWLDSRVNHSKELRASLPADDGEVPNVGYIFRALNIRVNPGEVLARGYVDTGDQVLVDKLSYHFRRPKRGEVFVFSTAGIAKLQAPPGRPHASPSQHYIKRLVALPEDRVRIEEPYLLINGERAKEKGFQKVMAATDGYNGYVTVDASDPSPFLPPGAEVTVPPDSYLPMGDNSRFSLDGRNFGPVRKKNLLGPALVVYWPFLPHFGFIR